MSSPDETTEKVSTIINIVALCVYITLLPLYIYYTKLSLRQEEMKNVYHYTVSASIFLTLMIRICCLLYSVVMPQSESNNIFREYTKRDYIYF